MKKTTRIFNRIYDAESLFDLERDVSEAVEDHSGGIYNVIIDFTSSDDFICRDCGLDQVTEFDALRHVCQKDDMQ